MTPPWVNTATVWSGWRRPGAIRASRTRRGEIVGRFGARDDVPALLGEHLAGERMALDDPDTKQAALPLAQVHLAQVGFDDRLEAQPGGQGGGGLGGAPQGAHVDGRDRLAASRSATRAAWARPSSASSGSPWPSTRANGTSGRAGADSP